MINFEEDKKNKKNSISKQNETKDKNIVDHQGKKIHFSKQKADFLASKENQINGYKINNSKYLENHSLEELNNENDWNISETKEEEIEFLSIQDEKYQEDLSVMDAFEKNLISEDPEARRKTDIAIEFVGITKDFGKLRANDNINIKVKTGTVHSLVGENGAGKSTLMSILFGLYEPTFGHINFYGDKLIVTGPNQANSLGIGMVHQHFKLVGNFTNLENIILGTENIKHGVIDKKIAEFKIKTLQDKFNLHFDLKELSENSTVATQQKVEIMKMLYRDASILIFDEPTAVLTPQEILGLLQTIKIFRQEGKTIIFISHKLNEVLDISDEITVIRHGKVVEHFTNTHDLNIQDISTAMIGSKVVLPKNTSEVAFGEVLFKLENVSAKLGHKKLHDINLSIRRGEITAIAGVEGNGQEILEMVSSGLIKADKGKIYLNTNTINNFYKKNDNKNKIIREECLDNIGFESIKDIDFENKSVMINISNQIMINYANPSMFNLDKNIIKAIKYIISKNGKVILIISGFPARTKEEVIKHSFENLGQTIANILKEKIIFVSQIKGRVLEDQISKLNNGEILLMENTKIADYLYNGAETNGDIQLAKYWASLTDYYMDELYDCNINKFTSSNIRQFAKQNIKGYTQYYLDKLENKNIINNENLDNQFSDITHYSIEKRIKSGITYIPGDRHKYGLVLDFNVMDNTILRRLKDHAVVKNTIINNKYKEEFNKKITSEYDVRGTKDGYAQARGLSGGNQQKIIVGREILTPHDFIIIVQPTRGLDIGAINIIHNEILKQKAQNKAILLISYELDEIFALADNIAVMHDGHIIGSAKAKNITREEIGLLMAGIVKNKDTQNLRKDN